MIFQKLKSLLFRAIIFFNKKNLERRRMIFSINPGRSGSNYLADLLETSDSTASFHEANPNMSGDTIDLINKYPMVDTLKIRKKTKLLFLKKQLLAIPENLVYCDTNQQFIKSFYDVVLSTFSNVEVIVLRRDFVSVLKSFVQLGFYTENHRATKKWMVSFDSPNFCFNPPYSKEKLDPIDSIITYLIEIELRIEKFKKDYPNVNIIEVYLDQLMDKTEVKKLFEKLNITYTSRTDLFTGKKVNERKDQKLGYTSQSPNITYEYCMNRLNLYLDEAKKHNLHIPQLYIKDN